MNEDEQRWTHTDDEGHTRTVVATPSRLIAGEPVFEVSEAVLGELLTAAGWVRAEVSR